MKQLIALALILLLALPAFGRERTPEQQVRRARLGSAIEATLIGGEKLKGRMGSVSAASFILEPEHSGRGTSRTIPFDQVLRIHGTEKRVVKTVVITLVVAAGALSVFLILLIASHPAFPGY